VPDFPLRERRHCAASPSNHRPARSDRLAIRPTKIASLSPK
jgi:hypothetical protein